MPLVPNLIERLAFQTLNAAPGPGLDIWTGPAYWCVNAALQLDLFATLKSDGMTPAELASKLKADERGLRILLGALESMGYVKRRGDSYYNTAMTEKWLLDGGEINFTPFWLYWGALMEHFMPNLAMSIRSGAPPVHQYEWIETQPEVSRQFQRAMIQIAHYISPDIVNAVKVPHSATRLLDVGGGHGEYSVMLCQQHPQLSAVVFDGPQALVTGRQAIDEAGLNDRIQTQAGNFIVDDLPTGFDVALVFNIVHGLLPDGNIDLFRKIYAALNPSGQIVVLEQVHGVAPLPLIDASSRILSMALFHMIGGQVYTFEEIKSWLQAAGFAAVSRKTILKISSVLVSARKD